MCLSIVWFFVYLVVVCVGFCVWGGCCMGDGILFVLLWFFGGSIPMNQYAWP